MKDPRHIGIAPATCGQRPVLFRSRVGGGCVSAEPDHAKRGVKLTYDDYVLFPDDGQRHELIDGEHYVTPSPNLRHQDISGRLFLLIGSWLDRHPIGRVFYAPLDVIFSHFDVVEPDLLYASHTRASEIMTGDWVRGAPELLSRSDHRARGRATRRSNVGSTNGSA